MRRLGIFICIMLVLAVGTYAQEGSISSVELLKGIKEAIDSGLYTPTSTLFAKEPTLDDYFALGKKAIEASQKAEELKEKFIGKPTQQQTPEKGQTPDTTTTTGSREDIVLGFVFDSLELIALQENPDLELTQEIILTLSDVKKQAQSAGFSPNKDISAKVAANSELAPLKDDLKTIKDADDTLRFAVNEAIKAHKAELEKSNEERKKNKEELLDLNIGNSPILYGGFGFGTFIKGFFIIIGIIILFVLVKNRRILGYKFASMFKFQKNIFEIIWTPISKAYRKIFALSIHDTYIEKSRLFEKNKKELLALLERMKGKNYAELYLEQKNVSKWEKNIVLGFRNMNNKMEHDVEKYENFLSKFQGIFRKRFGQALIEDRKELKKMGDALFPKTGETYKLDEIDVSKLTERQRNVVESIKLVKQMLDVDEFFVNNELKPDYNNLADALHKIHLALDAEKSLTKHQLDTMNGIITLKISGEQLRVAVETLEKTINDTGLILKKEESILKLFKEISKKFKGDIERLSDDEIRAMRRVTLTKEISLIYTKKTDINLVLSNKEFPKIENLKSIIKDPFTVSDENIVEMIEPLESAKASKMVAPAEQKEKELPNEYIDSKLSVWVDKAYGNDKLVRELNIITKTYFGKYKEKVKDIRQHLKDLLEDYYPLTM